MPCGCTSTVHSWLWNRPTSASLATSAAVSPQGSLRGTRIPSTRRITQEWGVAMATATKALATLNQEGLVRAVPGVGTVVAEPGPEGPATPRHGLTRDRIIRAAIALVDTEGLAALSMRRVATDFGVSTMALYRHVPSKGELVRLMSEAVFDGEPLGSRPHGWREQL